MVLENSKSIVTLYWFNAFWLYETAGLVAPH